MIDDGGKKAETTGSDAKQESTETKVKEGNTSVTDKKAPAQTNQTTKSTPKIEAVVEKKE